ncbi:MAG: T9SS type A sorting domain-containing protein [Bacteroidota bacterium]
MKIVLKLSLTALICCFGFFAHAQTRIDFESLPGSYAEGDDISTEYAAGDCGVTFYLLSETSGLHPKLAQVGGSTYYAFQGIDDLQCAVPGSTDVDMPDPSAGAGCFFITDDGVVNSSPDSLVIVWTNYTLQCSGDILDVDGTEAWRIIAWDDLGNVLDVIELDYTHPTAGNGLATSWSFINVGPIKKVTLAPLGGSNFGLALDNFDPCNAAAEYCCGGGKNLQTNSDFELGDTGFNSGYTVEGDPVNDLLQPGEYAIVNGATAAQISPNWNVVNSVTCDDQDDFLVVNGRTNLSGQKTVWRNTYTLDEDKSFIFCARVKNLPTCAFDVLPKIDIMAGSTVLASYTVDVDPSDPCAWELINVGFSTAGNTGPVAYTFKIRLAENEMGDGNDLAIDNISMREEGFPSTPSPTFTTTPNDEGTYSTVNASAAALDPGCFSSWIVCGLDNFGVCDPAKKLSLSSWNGLSDLSFANYDGTDTPDPDFDPGRFPYGRYEITHIVQCPCTKPGISTQTVSLMASSKMANPGLGGGSGEEAVHIYPNPAHESVTLEATATTEFPWQIQMLDLSGKSVLSAELPAGNRTWELRLPELPDGIYMLRINDGRRITKQKVIVRSTHE